MLRNIRLTCLAPLLGVAALGLLAAPAHAAEENLERNARGVVEYAATTVSETLTGERSLTEKRTQVDQVVREVLDEPVLSRLVLARNYRKLDEGQREAFARAFQEHLVNTYWRNASAGELVRIEILEDREERSGDWTVKTRVVAVSDDDIKVDYRLRRERNPETGENDGPWLVIDIIIESVSMVSNFRSQFQEIVGNDGVDGLLSKLQEKNAGARAEREQQIAEEEA